MYKKLIESIFESTKITINKNGEYDIEHTFSDELAEIFTSKKTPKDSVGTITMCSSEYGFVLFPSKVLAIFKYTGISITRRVFCTDGSSYQINYENMLPLPITEEQYFQQSTLHDFGDLELQDMRMIKDFYDVVSEFMTTKL